MRRVNVRDGIAQRINKIIGTDQGTLGETDFPGITDWSVQAAMLSNIRRVIRGIVGSAVGRPASGLWVVSPSHRLVEIGKGVGFTSNGDAIIIDSNFNYSIDAASGDVYLYLKHEMEEYKEADHLGDGGKSTEFIGKDNSNKEEIVYDDKGAALGNNVASEGESLIYESSSLLSQSSAPNYVYLCKVTISATTVVTPNYERCFDSTLPSYIGPTPQNGKMLVVPGLYSKNDIITPASVDCGKLKAEEIYAGSDQGITEEIELAGITTLKVKDGIIIGTIPTP